MSEQAIVNGSINEKSSTCKVNEGGSEVCHRREIRVRNILQTKLHRNHPYA